MYVLDASVALAWLFPDEATAAAEAAWLMLDTGHAIAPCHWTAEVVNGLAVGQRRGRISSAEASAGLSVLSEAKIEIVPLSVAVDGGILLTRSLQLALSVYDTAYLELAARFGVPLATIDQSLQKAARAIGVAIVGE